VLQRSWSTETTDHQQAKESTNMPETREVLIHLNIDVLTIDDPLEAAQAYIDAHGIDADVTLVDPQ
jgi:hypothetical protein